MQKPTRRALIVAATYQAGVAKLLEVIAEEIAEEMGQGGRAARLASKARRAGDSELRALMDRRPGWRDEDFARWQQEMREPPRPPR